MADHIIAQNRDVYNDIAEHFSSTRSFLWRDLGMLTDYVQDGDAVLDVGCGNGRLYQLFTDLSSAQKQQLDEPYKHIERKNVQYTGIDNSEELIKIARDAYRDAQFVVGDMRRLPFDSGSFDVVFSVVAFHHMPTRSSQEKALLEMKRVLKDGGYIVMLNWNAYSDWVNKKVQKGHYEYLGHHLFKVPWKTQDKEVIGDRIYYGFTPDELTELFENAKLTTLEQYYLRMGEESDEANGMNIVSVVQK